MVIYLLKCSSFTPLPSSLAYFFTFLVFCFLSPLVPLLLNIIPHYTLSLKFLLKTMTFYFIFFNWEVIISDSTLLFYRGRRRGIDQAHKHEMMVSCWDLDPLKRSPHRQDTALFGLFITQEAHYLPMAVSLSSSLQWHSELWHHLLICLSRGAIPGLQHHFVT